MGPRSEEGTRTQLQQKRQPEAAGTFYSLLELNLIFDGITLEI
jgi:hypothetical protein